MDEKMDKHRLQTENLRKKFAQLHQRLQLHHEMQLNHGMQLPNGNLNGWTGEAAEAFSAREAELYEEVTGILDDMEQAARNGEATV